MKQREKRNIIIGILCCMVVFMSVGYAVLSQTLKINGTANITGSWNIYIDSITFNKDESSSTTRGTGSVDQTDKTKATYSAELLKPQDVVVYDVVVANKGTIDAVLNDLVIDPTDTEYFTFETIGIAKGDELPAQTGDSPTTRSFKIKVTFKDSVTEANMPPAGTQVEGLVKLDYVQKTTTNFGTESTPGGDIEIPTEESPFKVTKDGVLIHYQRQGNETSVKVPAEVNGVKITKIAPYAFLNGDYILLNDEKLMVVTNPEMNDLGQQYAPTMGAEFITIEDLISETNTTQITNYGKHYEKYTVDLSTGEPQVRESENRITGYYLENIDLSDAIYLEEIMEKTFIGFEHTYEDSPEICSPYSVPCESKLKSAILPDSGNLTTIGDYAFADSALTTITIPSSVTTIGANVFDGQSGLTIKISKGTTEGMTLGENWHGGASISYDAN